MNKSERDVSSKRSSEDPPQLPAPKRLLLDIAETTQQQPGTSLLLPNELVTLHSEYVQELQNLRESFEATFKLDTVEDDSDPNIWAGVKNSSILTLGRLRTAFLHFDPHSYTAMTPTNSSINFLIYDSGSLQVTELDEEQNMVALMHLFNGRDPRLTLFLFAAQLYGQTGRIYAGDGKILHT